MQKKVFPGFIEADLGRPHAVSDFEAGVYIVVPESLTPVALLAMEATAVPGGIRVSWEVSHERETSGYRLYRSFGDAGPTAGARPALIPADGRRRYEYVDTGVDAGETYRYRLVSVGSDGRESVLATRIARAGVSAKIALSQNVPNPFNPQTEIRFVLPGPTTVSLSVYDVRGVLVRNLVTGLASAGENLVRWDGRDDRGNPVASGVYVCRLRVGKETLTRRMVLIR